MSIIEKDFISSGLRCVVVNHGRHRCGYVGVEFDHPLYGVAYSMSSPVLAARADQVKNGRIGNRGIITVFCAVFSGDDDYFARPDMFFDVHGSITFAEFGRGYPVDSPLTWWFGFDCNHCDDSMGEWTEAAVLAETERLARQIAEITDETKERKPCDVS